MIKTFLTSTGLLLTALVAYLLLWPVAIEPVAWQAPQSTGYVGDFAPNEKLKELKFFDLDGHEGPEDVAIAKDGLIYVSTRGGDILSLDSETGKVSVFANTGGRPLGIEFGRDGNLYVADAFRGLLAVGQNGISFLLADKTDTRSPIKYADDLDVSKLGEVYFSDASTKFGAEEYAGTLQSSLLDLMEHGPNGRMLKYDPAIGKTTVLLEGYSFANGVALAADESYLLFTETGTYRVHKLWLKGENSGTVEVIMDNLPGFPDNLNRNADGSFWLGLVSPRVPVADLLADKPFVRKIVQRLPGMFRPKPLRYGFVVRIDGDGNVLETLQDPSGEYALTTGAVDGPDGSVIVTSLTEKRLGILQAQ